MLPPTRPGSDWLERCTVAISVAPRRSLGACDAAYVELKRPDDRGRACYAPFGGEGYSGFGPREQGLAARELFTAVMTTTIAPRA